MIKSMFSPPSCEFPYFYTPPSENVPNVFEKEKRKAKKEKKKMERSFFSMNSSEIIVYTAKLLCIK